MSFIDAHRGRYGVGPVCAEVPRAPSTDYEHKAREGEPERASGRVRRDRWLCGEIRRVYDEPFGVYGVRKVWRQLRREGVTVARCTVARLMRRLGLQGAVRGRWAKTTRAVVQGERPDDRVNREFKVSRPNALWVSDLTYVAMWRGFAYTAFVIDAYARRIVGWRVSHSLHTDTDGRRRENPDRLRCEASFAMMCGACPIPASSGKTQRHRLNRGGNDRPTPPCT